MKSFIKYLFISWMCICSATVTMAQNSRLVSGRVMDVNGELLVGVSVQEVGTSNGTVTDINGSYRIQVTTPNPKLKFTYVGFKEKTLSVPARGVLDVSLNEDIEALDEVVVVGYGQQKKASVVGSIMNVEPGQLAITSSRSLSNNLAGMVSGVIAVQRSGNPWFNNSDFWIRGISSFAGNTNPLVLVDGVERSLHDIDPEEIESFSVLKDAAASAVYGVRGANGVIMIQTKRGKIGKPNVNARYERTFSTPIHMVEYVGSVKYLQLVNEIRKENGQPPMASEATLLNYEHQTDPELYPDINWWKEVAKDRADQRKVNLSVNGGTDVLRYALVLGVFNESGIIKTDPEQEWDSSLKVSRYTVRSNVDVNVTPSTLLRINIGGMLQTRNAPPGDDETNFGIFYQAMRIPPYVHPPKYADGKIPRVVNKQNPWAFATQRGYEKINHSKIESLTSLEQDLSAWTPGLKAKLTFSFDKFAANSVRRAKEPDYYNVAAGRDANGELITDIQTHGQQFLDFSRGSAWGDQSIYFEGVLSYARTFNAVHDINGMLLYNQKSYDRGDPLPYRNQGMAGRLSYTYDRRYVGEFNFGYNGSENFAPGKRFGFFPAGALGWIISQEPFMEPYREVLSNLKLRGSIGQAGNSIIGGDIGSHRFAYISTISPTGEYWWGSGDYIHRMGRAEGEVGVSDLTWETVTKKNIGLELGLFNNSISLIADLFREDRKDIFMQRRNIPGSAGFIRPVWANYGKVKNQGVDISLKVNRQINEDWYVSALGNFTYAHNEIVEIDEPKAKIGTYRSETGHPVGQFFGLIAEGLYTDEDFTADGKLKEGLPIANFSEVTNLRPGDIKYRDMDGDGYITDKDRTAIGGTFNPEIIYGFGANLRWRMIDFGVFFQGAGNTYQMLHGETFLPGSVLGAGNIFSNIDDRWTPENPSQDVFWPRIGDRATANNSQASTWWLRDMSFLRLKSMELGCSLPPAWMNKVGVRHARLFVRGANLLTFSKFKLWDPELDTSDGLKYPFSRSISVGLNIDFNN